MEIPGISPFSNQPTVTNPLSSEEALTGQQVPEQVNSETSTTTTVQEQNAAALSDNQVVNQTNQTENNDNNRIGNTIDFTV